MVLRCIPATEKSDCNNYSVSSTVTSLFMQMFAFRSIFDCDELSPLPKSKLLLADPMPPPACMELFDYCSDENSNPPLPTLLPLLDELSPPPLALDLSPFFLSLANLLGCESFSDCLASGSGTGIGWSENLSLRIFSKYSSSSGELQVYSAFIIIKILVNSCLILNIIDWKLLTH